MHRRHIGNHGEDIACKHLHNLGYTIVQRNFTIRGGEIDIIATKDRITYFVEVKYRTSDHYGHPLETMTDAKLEAFERTVLTYCEKYSLDVADTQCLFVGIFDDGKRKKVDIVNF